jgi:hypothetical protein
MPKIWTHRKACRLCNSRNVVPILKFAFTPPELIARPDVPLAPEHTEKVPLVVSLCEKCRTVQSLDLIKPELLFDDYPFSDVPSAPASFYDSFAQQVADRGHLHKGDLVVDIGSGNHRLLRLFKSMGFTVISVDPSQPSTELAAQLGIHHYRDYFSPAVAAQILKTHGKVSAVTATFVIGSIDNLHTLASGVRHMLKQDGLFFFAEPYLGDILLDDSFERITHETISLISLAPLDTFFRSVFFHLIDVRRDESARCLVGVVQRSDGPHVASAATSAMIQSEKENGMPSTSAITTFVARAEQKKQSIQQQVSKITTNGGRVAGIGVSNNMVTCVHECGWDRQAIACVLDYNPKRIGSMVSGTDIPIVSWKRLQEETFGAVVVMGAIGSEEAATALHDYRKAGGLVISAA